MASRPSLAGSADRDGTPSLSWATRRTTRRPYAGNCGAAGIPPVISRKGAPNIKGLGKLRYVVEQTFTLLHQFKRLAVRWDRRIELHDALVSLGCSLICWRRLKKIGS